MLRKTKSFKDMVMRTVDFREKIQKKFPIIKTVDFREKKDLNETIHGQTPHFKPLFFSGPQSETVDHKLVDNLDNHYSSHNEKHNAALRAYTSYDDVEVEDNGGEGVESSKLNEHLFDTEGNPKEHTTQIQHLDKLTSMHKAPHDFYVYSGLHNKPEPGQVHVHHGYMSSSIHSQVASNFSRQRDGVHHILKLKIPKGSRHGFHIGSREEFTKYQDEHEFLLSRGKKIHIHPEPEIFDHHTADKTFSRKTHVWHGTIQE